MHRPGLIFTAVITAAVLVLGSAQVFASSQVLKKEAQGSEVTALQKDLKKLGYIGTDPTGYYGDITEEAVIELQREYGYDADGIAGETTLSLIDRLLGRSSGQQSGKAPGSSSALLKEGVEGSPVEGLQKDLIKLGYLDTEATGYFGPATAAAVRKLQKDYGYDADGVAGSGTLQLIENLLSGGSKSSKTSSPKKTSTGSKATSSDKKSTGTSYMLPWFSTVEDLFKVGDTAVVYDIATGLSFKAKRTYGHNHADCETLTAKDTTAMKKIFGGQWSWDRRAVIVTVNGRKIAASMAGMPHAGSDRYADGKLISSRSGGYGRGDNMDAVKGNNMSGVFDIHFYGSKTHNTNRVDSEHQKMVKKAAAWARENL